MPSRAMSLLGTLFLFLAIATAAPASEDATDAYGVYMKTDDGYTALERIPSRRHLRYDFTGEMFDFPIVNRPDGKVELVVHYPDFHPSILQVEARSMASATARSPVEVSIAPMEGDKYRVTTAEEVAEDRILLVHLGCCVDGVYGAALSDPRSTIMAHFAEGKDLNPASAAHVMSEVTDAVPDDAKLQDLHAYWQRQEALEEATEHYAFIEKIWAQYEAAEGAEARIGKLEDVQSLCKQYLEDHPEGRERGDVKALLERVEKKLDV